MRIDLNDNIPGSANFYWSEALYLGSLGSHVFPRDSEVYDNIIKTTKIMEYIRELIDCPVRITSFYRPEKYNKHIGGSIKSAHIQGLACDFVPIGEDLQECTRLLIPHLEKLNIRMEKHSGNWIHIDLMPVINNRYFKP